MTGYGAGGPASSSPTPTTWPARAPRSRSAIRGEVPVPPRRVTTGPWSNSTRSSSSKLQDGTSNTLLLGEFGRGSGNIGIGNWFVAWDASVQRISIAGINRPYTAPLPFADRMNPPAQPPLQGPQSYMGFGSYHPGGANFAFGDGSVRFIKETTDLRVLAALGTRAGGEVVSASDY